MHSYQKLAYLLIAVPSASVAAFLPASSSTSLFSSFVAAAAPTTSCASSTQSEMPKEQSIPRWYQHEVTITAPSRGCHLITLDVNKAIKDDLPNIKIGMANLFIQHTSASLTINENADPDVRRDMEMALNKIVPASWNHDGTFRHTMEGDDDMPGHVKSSLMGPSLNIPIRNGRLALGTWQGILLNEHRDQGGWGGGHSRNIIITLQGTS
uniref:Secondary thiamine-phosphate synthase enzyme n=1 Tax=Attheya septentrionalis TaxID=420275 RepID=A0A7S2UNK1_9STRA|mmetsp:Transcript_5808/g.10291  ORF Transcript_5808/g.10291 Transcript_5808/m.10291 type:complete len:210 (+) Transcript_5808:185-814(+)